MREIIDNEINDIESGFFGESGVENGGDGGMTDVEILSVTGVNVIARGRRYGRFWLLKGLIPELRESPSARRRLQKEFEIHSRLLHPNVVRVAALEDIPSLGPCIVEEWVEGTTLADLLREGNLPKSERRRLLREIISAVGYLHSSGVVHRDLKPQNIMVRKEGGKAVLIDFGLADTGDWADLKQAAGSKGYISPEQFAEGGARVSDDIYSLGVIIRELCPEYSRVAARCTGPVEKRPRSAEELLRMLIHADRRPKLMAWGAAALILVVGVAAVSLHVRSISAGTMEAKAQIDTLTNANTENLAKIDRLEYILAVAEERLNTTQYAISSAESENGQYRRGIIDSYRKMEKEFLEFDLKQIPKFSDDRDPGFQDSVFALMDRCDLIARKAYDTKRFPELARADSAMFVGRIRELADRLFAQYRSAWGAYWVANQHRKFQYYPPQQPESAKKTTE